ncbi:MAG TPA: OB-fold nucleic acid binding domain-containing protein, partial [Candidatus Nanoarchaeia archaeon]|nr:OB-fold nucleic acid binding domain-containing protein [Candidatus Nanoarchaeia archaeon]
MPTEEELIAERKRKREELLQKGINPYPYRYEPTHKSIDVSSKYAGLKPEDATGDAVKVAGRIVGLRRLGKATFMHILDEKGKLQIYYKFDDIPKIYDLLKLTDVGDWIGVEGTIFKTSTGEITVKATNFEVLCKSLRPLPEKWHGLKDVEQRYRKRYVDLTINPEIRKTFVK